MRTNNCLEILHTMRQKSCLHLNRYQIITRGADKIPHHITFCSRYYERDMRVCNEVIYHRRKAPEVMFHKQDLVDRKSPINIRYQSRQNTVNTM